MAKKFEQDEQPTANFETGQRQKGHKDDQPPKGSGRNQANQAGSANRAESGEERHQEE